MENKIRYQPIVLFLACLAIIAADAGKLKPAEITETAINLRKPLMLSCQAENPEETKLIEWKKIVTVANKETSVSVESFPPLNGRYTVKSAEGKFVIDRPSEVDEGKYECVTPSGERNIFTVWVLLVVKVPDNIYVVEGEKLEINCIVKGSQPNVTWKFRTEFQNASEAEDYPASDRVQLTAIDKVENANLTIVNVKQSDRGIYSCIVNSIHTNGDVQDDGFVRVKDKFAALWPFIGICAEVFVLCAIILIYEKRRNKDSDNDSDTDQGDQKK